MARMLGSSLDSQPFDATLRQVPAATRPATTHLTISVVIVNFNQWKNTARLVRQLRRSATMKTRSGRIVIVDNGSKHHPIEGRLRKLRGVDIVPNEENLGFATAVNRGVSTCETDWTLFLNPDVTVPDEFLDDVLNSAEKLLRSQPNAGIVGFKLQNRDGSTQPSCGPLPTLANTITGVFAPRWKRKCKPLPDVYAAVPWATGGCLLVRRDCFRALGGFDQRFFLYYEDVDLCKRALEAGYGVWYSPDVAAIHHWPLHSRPVPAPLRLITRHALLHFARQNWPRWQAWILGRIVRLEAKVRSMWADRAGNHVAASFYRQLKRLVRDLETGRTDKVSRRIESAAEHLAAVAAAQDGRTT
ncbi:MAG: glycosyltransferase family 2 protein [Gemmataceae bacterium]